MRRIKLKRKTINPNPLSGLYFRVRPFSAGMWTSAEYGTSLYLCVHTFNRYFAFPRRCNECELVFTKTPHPEAYKMELGYSNQYTIIADVPLLDQYAPNFAGNARVLFRKLWNQGYTYVRVEVAA